MFRWIIIFMNLENPKRPVIWNGGSSLVLKHLINTWSYSYSII